MKSMQAPNRAIHLIHCSENFFKMWNVGLGVDFLTQNRVDHGDFIVRFSNLKNLKKEQALIIRYRSSKACRVIIYHNPSIGQNTRFYVVTS